MFDRLDSSDVADREEVLGFWRDKFGVSPETFDEFDLYVKGESKVWIADSDAEFGAHVDQETLGMPFLRIGDEHPKPTGDALQRFGSHVTENVVDVAEEQARTFVAGDTVEMETREVDLGYVAVRFDGRVLGCGLYFPGELRSQVPKGRRCELVL